MNAAPSFATTVAADSVDPQALAECFNASFANYIIGSMTVDVPGLTAFLARQGADLSLSRVGIDANGQPLGFAFIGRREEARLGPRSRVGGMGLVPQARGSGLAPHLLDEVIAAAVARGDAAIELEVFAQNTPAYRLYRARGFADVMPLYGYVREPAPDNSANVEPPQIDVLPLSRAADWLAAQDGDMPFQQSAHALRAPAMRGVAWQTGRALVVFDLQPGGTLALKLVHEGADAKDGALAALIARLVTEHPGARLLMPALLAPQLGGDTMEESLGFVRQELHQILMRRPLV